MLSTLNFTTCDDLYHFIEYKDQDKVFLETHLSEIPVNQALNISMG